MRKGIRPFEHGASPPSDRPDQDHTLYRFLVDSLTEFAVFAVATDGIVISWNTGAQATFGYTTAEMLGHSFDRIFSENDRQIGAPQRELAAALSGEQMHHDRWHVRKDGSRFWGTNTVQPLHDSSGELIGFTKLVRDTTQNHVALEQLRDSEQQLRLLLGSVRDVAIFSFDPRGFITSWNSGAEKVFGYLPGDIVGHHFSALFEPNDVAAGVALAELSDAATHGSCSTERWQVRKDGSRFLASGKTSRLNPGPSGDQRGFVKIAHDITEHHAAAEDLRRRAYYDELTDLPNRRTFYEHLARSIATMKRRPPNVFAVLFVDLDHFKTVNDEFGHVIADRLLVTVARRLERCLRSEDIVGRIGGDEFAILLNGIGGEADAREAADRVGLEMRQPIRIEQREVQTSASVGIAIGAPHYDRPEDILRDADAAMYAAKLQGRARAVLFDSAIRSRSDTEDDLAVDLQRAIERAELRAVYQPIVRMADGRVVGFEAFVRWRHRRRGLLMPADFIPLAEHSGLIIAIDRWMMAAACTRLADWQARGIAGSRLQMSVNVSGRAFAGGELPLEIARTLRETGVAARCLRLDVTENTIVEISNRAVELTAAIRALGVSIDIDHFGSGYSALAALRDVTVDGLKIDSSFVTGIDAAFGGELVEAVVGLAHRLHATASAQGVETRAQLQRLSAFGCDLGQGFLFASALDAGSAGRLLERDRALP